VYTFNGEFRRCRNIAALTGRQWFYAKVMFAKASSPFGNVQGCTFPNNGIHAASAINAQRIISATDGGGIKQQRCFLVYKKLDVKQLYTDVQLFNIAARPDGKT